MGLIPTMIDLQGKRVVVVGGGIIAERKINNIISAKPKITLISPNITPKLQTLVDHGQIKWLKKNVSSQDLKEAFLIIAATNKEEVNQQIVAEAPDYALINAASDAEAGNVQFPIYLQRGKLSIAISTSGASPILAKKIKQKLEKTYDESYENYLDFLFEVRTMIKNAKLDREEKQTLLTEVVTNDFMNAAQQTKYILSLQQKLKKRD
ncbi:NAD(P)-binding protein [Aquibacillus albus]|uniref:precorrin-2 dehydrogenase n=1 Tax=Aquibacillus albus TaxID=1168171 RepID=A0ABS2N596_9BACI|nr:NAD(P)-binding protein [Aquibacillus albus]MBM7573218.1 precorrin-2 dehydrogenase/sirohydrochlorin ferrochelatase [Aquibacillus albus]